MCSSRFRCRVCKRKHHTSICNESSPSPVQTNSYGNSLSLPLGQSTQASTNASILHTNTIHSTPDVFLKTAITPICTESSSSDANILFVAGAQRSFITQKLAEELNLTRTGSALINLASFGDSVRSMDTATVLLKTDSGSNIPMNVLIVPTIAVPLNIRLYKQAVDLPYLRQLKLAHPVPVDYISEISVLIGADYFWQIVENIVINGNGPTAVSSKTGYLLSGPLSDETLQSQVSVNMVMKIVTTPQQPLI